ANRRRPASRKRPPVHRYRPAPRNVNRSCDRRCPTVACSAAELLGGSLLLSFLLQGLLGGLLRELFLLVGTLHGASLRSRRALVTVPAEPRAQSRARPSPARTPAARPRF